MQSPESKSGHGSSKNLSTPPSKQQEIELLGSSPKEAPPAKKKLFLDLAEISQSDSSAPNTPDLKRVQSSSLGKRKPESPQTRSQGNLVLTPKKAFLIKHNVALQPGKGLEDYVGISQRHNGHRFDSQEDAFVVVDLQGGSPSKFFSQRDKYSGYVSSKGTKYGSPCKVSGTHLVTETPRKRKFGLAFTFSIKSPMIDAINWEFYAPKTEKGHLLEDRGVTAKNALPEPAKKLIKKAPEITSDQKTVTAELTTVRVAEWTVLSAEPRTKSQKQVLSNISAQQYGDALGAFDLENVALELTHLIAYSLGGPSYVDMKSLQALPNDPQKPENLVVTPDHTNTLMIIAENCARFFVMLQRDNEAKVPIKKITLDVSSKQWKSPMQVVTHVAEHIVFKITLQDDKNQLHVIEFGIPGLYIEKPPIVLHQAVLDVLEQIFKVVKNKAKQAQSKSPQKSQANDEPRTPEKEEIKEGKQEIIEGEESDEETYETEEDQEEGEEQELVGMLTF